MTDMSTKLGKIFIGGLSYETTDDKLRQYFGAYGPVTDAVVMKDPISRRSRGFGFITYSDAACVDRALAQPNHILDSRRVEAKRAVPRAESTRDSSSTAASISSSTSSVTQSSANINSSSSILSSSNSLHAPNMSSRNHHQHLSSSGRSTSSHHSNSSSSKASSSPGSIATKKIFVGGLHYETKDADFKNYFEQYGKVISTEVMFNRETNKSRGFGFVVFEVENSVELVLQNKNHIIDAKAVEVKRAVPRTDAPPSTKSVQGGTTATSTTTSTARIPGSSNSSTSSIGRTQNSSYTNNGDDEQPVPQPRSFAAVASGSLGGYAAAVRYGGKGYLAPQHPSGNSLSLEQEACDSSNSSNIVEDMDKVSLGDESLSGGLYRQEPQSATFSSPSQQDFGSHAMIGSPQPVDLSLSPPLSSSSTTSNVDAWSNYSRNNNTCVEHPQLPQYHQYETGLDHQPQPPPPSSTSSPPFQWNQSQWGTSSTASSQWGQGGIPSSSSEQSLPPPPGSSSSQSSHFFSMFGAPSMNDHPKSIGHAVTNNGPPRYGGPQGPWDNAPPSGEGVYSGPGLGMGGFSSSMGMGMGMQGMGLGAMDPAMAGLNMPPPQGTYGGFGSASLGTLGRDDYHSSIGALAGPNVTGLNTSEDSTGATDEHNSDQQQQLNYGSYPNSQFPTYR